MPTTAKLPFNWPLRVYIEDTDAGGIVYYVNYLKFMERARSEHFRALGVPKAAVFDDDALFVVHSAKVNYRKPALLDDQLVVSSAVTKVGRAYVVFTQTIERDGELICEGEIKVACVSKNELKPMAMPKAFYNKLNEQ